MTTYAEAVREVAKGRKIDMRRIPSNKERIRKAKKKGGFDETWIDKKHMKNLEETHRCYYCKEYMKPITDFVHSKGKIIMSCDTDDCLGNYGTKRSSCPPEQRRFAGRILDRKLCFDLAKLLIGRDPSRLWATRKRTI